MWRVDHCRNGSTRPEETIWREGRMAAELVALKLRLAGIERVVAWFDAANYEGADA